MQFNPMIAYGILKSIEKFNYGQTGNMSDASWTVKLAQPEDVMHHFEILVEAGMIKAEGKIVERLTLKGHQLLSEIGMTLIAAGKATRDDVFG